MNARRTFVFHSILEAHQFLTTLPLPRQTDIHSIRIAWLQSPSGFEAIQGPIKRAPASAFASVKEQWKEICRVLSSMDYLYDLQISVYRETWFQSPTISEKELLAPLMKVRARKFVVRLPWQSEATLDDLIEPPFILGRPLPRNDYRTLTQG